MAARAHAGAALRAVRAALARSTGAAAGEQTLAVGHAALGAGVHAGGCARATVPFAAARALASLPQVETVSVTVFNARGERFVLPGVVGRSVMDAVLNHPELPLASEHDNTLFNTPNNEWGVVTKDCRVSVMPSYMHNFPPRDDYEEDFLKDTYMERQDELLDNTRLASRLKLTKECEGLTVAVEEVVSWATP